MICRSRICQRPGNGYDLLNPPARKPMTAAATALRTPEHAVDPQFHARWSPRAFTGEEIPEETLLGLFEAARWAPSAMNAQPWRFAYARRGTQAFDALLATLAPANQAWATRASALIALASRTTMALPGQADPVPSRSHGFDAGAAWANLALQAHLWGWSTHAMGGFDMEKARAALAVPADLELQVVIAVGKKGDATRLPDWARARENPNERKPVGELVREGSFAP
jgi:nitroreductase